METSIAEWITGPSLPEPLGHYQSVITDNKIYLLGGYNGRSSVSTVYTTTINSDGTLGTWITGPSLPIPLSHSQAIITESRIYLIGGYNGNRFVPNVYTASIGINGTLGAWDMGPALPEPLSNSQVIVFKNKVYLLGGYNGRNYVSKVYVASIDKDGILDTWFIESLLPEPLVNSQAIIVKDRIYLLGGQVSRKYLNTVYTTIVSKNGTLGTWTALAPLPEPLVWSQSTVTESKVYLLGGFNSKVWSPIVYFAPINAEGTLGSWSVEQSLPEPLGCSRVIVVKNRLYLIGGWNGNTWTSKVYTSSIKGTTVST